MSFPLLRLFAPLFFPRKQSGRPCGIRRFRPVFSPVPFLGRPLLAVLVLAVCAGIQPAAAQPAIKVNISGDIDEQQLQNIRSRLSLARLPDNETPSEALFKRLYGKARQEIAKALEPFGYYTPEISVDQQWQGGVRQVDIKVDKGLPVTVEEVNIALSGPGEHDERLHEAIRRFPVRQGEVLDHQVYENSKDALVTAALENGYHRAMFRSHRVEISRKKRSALVRLDLDTGPRFLVGPITFDTNIIDHDLLRRISPIREGDPFSPKALTRLRQSLFNTGYFKTVDLDYDLDHTLADKVPIKVALTPNLAHKYGIGLGYGTDTGARGTLEYTNRYVNRFGHQLDMQLQPAQRKSNFGGTYSIPIGNPSKDRIALTGKYETEEFDNTETETLNATISHDHFREWGEYSTFVQFLDERYSTGPEATNQDSLVVPGFKGSVVWADDRITTKRGLRISATVIGSEENLLADTAFLQPTLRAKVIYSFFDQWRLLGRGEIGTTLVDDIYALPPTLRYYAGGDQSVRGYGYKKIGPIDANGNVIGGKDLLTYSVELERMLFDAWSGAIFYDSGTATNDFSTMTLHSGAGIGVRWNGVFGQIRLDLAKALDEEGTWRIHFSMGADL
ncbi:MAG: autotransporter assembly complex protein TamA [Desulfobulbus sp.]|jgi:translocation and assembly module TamA|uniref:autotransporter assembly complex protein TamA n=1 Tax=Desulfobulbus sp. TaxID=895 RepID=UPI00284EAE0F|nr:autotransporter assembly complex family protein [Desulfobulbus sp.]MDR2549857.1 autotransporter assembly complex protein TamA [Desulfobulbus sp.]